jgi:hypothetical protein
MADLETEIDVAFNGAWRRLPARLWDATTPLFLGGVLTATSVSISPEVLRELSGYAPSSAQPF